MTGRRLVLAVLTAVALLLGACGGAGGRQQPPAATEERGGEALGGGARTVTLARREGVEPPSGRLVWSGWRIELEAGDEVRHRHGIATVLAERGGHRLEGPAADVLEEGEGAAVDARVAHRHVAADGAGSVFSEVVLAKPGYRPSRAPEARRLFESRVLEGLPETATLHFIEVILPPGSETSVHTHPGPEFIHGTKGRFDYENAIEGARRFGPGDTAGIPPDTAVQKRNRSGAEARFLSWFLVDPDEPFAPGADFGSPG